VRIILAHQKRERRVLIACLVFLLASLARAVYHEAKRKA
jgi:hypothetical protein